MQTEETGFGPQEHSDRAAESWHNSGCVQTWEADRASLTDCLTRPTTLRGTLTRRECSEQLGTCENREAFCLPRNDIAQARLFPVSVGHTVLQTAH